MRVIKSDSSGIEYYQKILRHIHASSSDLLVWQVLPETGKRNIAHSRLSSYHFESGLMHLKLSTGHGIVSHLPLYCYLEDEQLIFKTEIREAQVEAFTVGLPLEIKLLEEPDVDVIKVSSGISLSTKWKSNRILMGQEDHSDFMKVKSMSERSSRDQEFLNNEFNSVSLDEEEKLFADKRESPRARPKIDKWVKVSSEASEGVEILKLFDLSQGGIAFVTFEPHLFPKGAKIKVTGFDQFNLDDPLIGQVMSQRPIDEHQTEFKIGCKFDEGQD